MDGNTNFNPIIVQLKLTKEFMKEYKQSGFQS